MKKLSEPIVFFGSGPVAAASLELLQEWAEVEAVVTKSPPPHHHGAVPVLELAERLRLPVYTVDSKTTLDTLFARPDFTSRLAVLVDFGIIVSQAVIDYFPLGIINSHFSLLPEWRGADPITFSVLSGQKQTGVSLMLLVAAMDEGPLLAQAPYDLPANITTPQLTEDLVEVSNHALQTILPEHLAGNLKPIAQVGEPTYSRKLTKADSQLDFTKPAAALEREIRAFLGWPKSRTTIAGKEVVITKAHLAEGTATPGKASAYGKELRIGTAEGFLVIDTLKPAGKPEMTAQAFLAGYGSKL
jgi:methionyl-tRNA formyltransferase